MSSFVCGAGSGGTSNFGGASGTSGKKSSSNSFGVGAGVWSFGGSNFNGDSRSSSVREFDGAARFGAGSAVSSNSIGVSNSGGSAVVTVATSGALADSELIASGISGGTNWDVSDSDSETNGRSEASGLMGFAKLGSSYSKNRRVAASLLSTLDTDS